MAKTIAKKANAGGLQKSDWQDRLKQFAKANPVEKAAEGIHRIRIMDGEFMLGEDEMPSTFETVVVNYSFENAYYDEDWDPDRSIPPACFAVGLEEDDLAPHEDSPEPQADSCAECWANKFKSKGKGKACANKRRLALLDLDSVENGEPEVHMFKVSATGIKAWRKVNKKADTEFGLPIQGVIVEMSIDKENKKKTAAFSIVEEVEDEAMFEAISKQYDECQEALLAPLSVEFEEEEEKKPAPRVSKKRGAEKSSAREVKDVDDVDGGEEEEETPQQKAVRKKREARARKLPARRNV